MPCGRRGDGVAARQVRRALRDVAALGGWRQERAQAGPDSGHVGPGELRGGDGVRRIEQVVHVLGGAGGVVEGARVVGVGRAEVDEVGPGPGHDEDGALVLGHRDDRSDVTRKPVGGHGDVHALGRTDRVRVPPFVEGPHHVGPDTGGVDHDARPDGERGRLVVGVGAHDGSVGRSVGARREADDGGVVGHGGAELERGRAGEGHGQSGVVRPGVEVEEAGHQVLDVQRREVGQGLGLVDPSVALADAPATGEVVHPQCRGVRAGHRLGHDAVAPEERDQERQRGDQVRRIVEEALPLGQVLVDEAELTLLEVADAAVDHLGRLGRGARTRSPPSPPGPSSGPGWRHRGRRRHRWPHPR